MHELSGTDGQVGTVDSASDARTINNVMRHAYKVLNDEEKAHMKKIKDMGADFHTYLSSLGDDRELSIAKERLEEVIMWAVKSLTK